MLVHIWMNTSCSLNIFWCSKNTVCAFLPFEQRTSLVSQASVLQLLCFIAVVCFFVIGQMKVNGGSLVFGSEWGGGPPQSARAQRSNSLWMSYSSWDVFVACCFWFHSPSLSLSSWRSITEQSPPYTHTHTCAYTHTHTRLHKHTNPLFPSYHPYTTHRVFTLVEIAGSIFINTNFSQLFNLF